MFWLLLLLLVPACSDEPAKKTAVEAPTPIFLWEAKHETGTAYLFGTIHLPDPRVLKLPRVIDEAFERSDVVLTELDMSPANRMKMQAMMLLPRGEKLSRILPKELQARFEKYLPLAAVDNQKIWAATVTVMMLQAREMFMSGRQPLDLELPLRAKAEGKEVGALEEPEEQIGVFDRLDTEEQIEMLEEALTLLEKDKAEGTNSMHKMVQLYIDGDIDGILKYQTLNGREPTERDKRFMKWILDDRNVHMADRLAERMKKAPGKTWFVAVGAAHYTGAVSVQKLLEEKGFKVRRIVRTDKLPAVKKPEPELVPSK